MGANVLMHAPISRSAPGRARVAARHRAATAAAARNGNQVHCGVNVKRAGAAARKGLRAARRHGVKGLGGGKVKDKRGAAAAAPATAENAVAAAAASEVHHHIAPKGGRKPIGGKPICPVVERDGKVLSHRQHGELDAPASGYCGAVFLGG